MHFWTSIKRLEDDHMQVLNHSTLSRFLHDGQIKFYAESCSRDSTGDFKLHLQQEKHRLSNDEKRELF